MFMPKTMAMTRCRKNFTSEVAVAKQKTAPADLQLGEDGKPIEEENFGKNVIVVARTEPTT